MRTLIVGCGYVGKTVACTLLNEGHQVLGTTRTEDSADKLRKSGISAIASNWLAEENKLTHDPFDLIIVAVSHAPVDGIPPEGTHVRGLQALQQGLKQTPRLLLYCSTTGVFQDSTSASWVDESSPVRATRPGTINALAAEEWLRSYWSRSPAVVLRLAGVYGSGRIPNIAALRNNQPLQVDPDSYLNLIHVQDIATTIHAIVNAPPKHSLYVVSDGHPVRRRTYYEWLCKQLDIAPPQYAPIESTNISASRGFGNKRVSNRRLIEECDLRWAFPSYREGLKSCLTDFPSD